MAVGFESPRGPLPIKCKTCWAQYVGALVETPPPKRQIPAGAACGTSTVPGYLGLKGGAVAHGVNGITTADHTFVRGKRRTEAAAKPAGIFRRPELILLVIHIISFKKCVSRKYTPLPYVGRNHPET